VYCRDQQPTSSPSKRDRPTPPAGLSASSHSTGSVVGHKSDRAAFVLRATPQSDYLRAADDDLSAALGKHEGRPLLGGQFLNNIFDGACNAKSAADCENEDFTFLRLFFEIDLHGYASHTGSHAAESRLRCSFHYLPLWRLFPSHG
jgi:hypothetical protein